MEMRRLPNPKPGRRPIKCRCGCGEWISRTDRMGAYRRFVNRTHKSRDPAKAKGRYAAQKRRIDARKAKYMPDHCQACGGPAGECGPLLLHHVIPRPSGEPWIGNPLWLGRTDRLEAELAKCIFVGAVCHADIHHIERLKAQAAS